MYALSLSVLTAVILVVPGLVGWWKWLWQYRQTNIQHFTGRCPSCLPSNSVKGLFEGKLCRAYSLDVYWVQLLVFVVICIIWETKQPRDLWCWCSKLSFTRWQSSVRQPGRGSVLGRQELSGRRFMEFSTRDQQRHFTLSLLVTDCCRTLVCVCVCVSLEWAQREPNH